MIPSITIENYRLFSQLHVSQLGQVNLLVGRNNVGKSAFLEAVRVLATEGSLWTIRSIVGGRLDSLSRAASPRLRNDDSLFNWNSKNRELRFRVYSGTSRSVTVDFGYFRKVSEDGEATRFVPLDSQDEPRSGELAYVIHRSNEAKPVRISSEGAMAVTAFEPEANCVHVGIPGFSQIEIGEMWERVVLTPREIQLNRFLSECFPEIERVAVSPLGSSTRVIVKLTGSLAPISMRSMGEGVSRVFSLALAAASVSGGVLLIDEVETGLHYSVQLRFWRFLVAAAHEFQVQVFATTHSSDAVGAFSRACLGNQDVNGRLISLRRWEGRVVAAEYSEEEQQFAEETGKELR